VRRSNRLVFTLASCLFVASLAATTNAQTQLPADLTEKIDKVVTDTLSRTGVPSASVAIVKTVRSLIVKAYGDARIEPKTAATPAMRYSIGSISKQFTAAAMLLLQEQGKLLARRQGREVRSGFDARE
jgi:CubicO group peptidase (beta-lactamase class C family)